MSLAKIVSLPLRHSPSWMGWDATLLGELLDADSDAAHIGTALCRVLAERVLPNSEEAFEFQLYRHIELEDRYIHIGTWSNVEGPEGPIIRLSALSPLLRRAREVDADLFNQTVPQPDELFFPLESHHGVIGFGIFRLTDSDALETVPDEDMFFLTRVAGQSFGQLLQSDRLDLAHQSMQTTMHYLESILALSTEAILLIDRDGRILVANESVESCIGQPSLDLVGELVQDVIPSEGTVALLGGAHQAEMRDEALTKTFLRRSLDPNGTGEVEAVFQSVRQCYGTSPGVLVRLRRLESGEAADWPTDQSISSDTSTGALTRPLLSTRNYLRLLRDETKPSDLNQNMFQSMDAQLEWLQSQLDARVLAEEFQTGTVAWRDRPTRASQLVTASVERVRSQFQKKGVELRLDLDEELRIPNLDLKKCSIALGCLLNRAVSQPAVESVKVEVLLDPADPGQWITRVGAEGGPSQGVPLCEDSGGDEYAYTTPLVESVARHYDGTVTIDVDSEFVFTAEIRIPIAK